MIYHSLSNNTVIYFHKRKLKKPEYFGTLENLPIHQTAHIK